MARKFKPQIATGNHLLEGDVVYFTAVGTWSRSLTDASVAQTPEQGEILLGAAARFQQQVVGVYLAEVEFDCGAISPGHFREVFRMRGPSNYFHGKQAEV